eukprot:8701007-Prorocentrum_lima.AAC.1
MGPRGGEEEERKGEHSILTLPRRCIITGRTLVAGYYQHGAGVPLYAEAVMAGYLQASGAEARQRRRPLV